MRLSGTASVGKALLCGTFVMSSPAQNAGDAPLPFGEPIVGEFAHPETASDGLIQFDPDRPGLANATVRISGGFLNVLASVRRYSIEFVRTDEYPVADEATATLPELALLDANPELLIGPTFSGVRRAVDSLQRVKNKVLQTGGLGATSDQELQEERQSAYLAFLEKELNYVLDKIPRSPRDEKYYANVVNTMKNEMLIQANPLERCQLRVTKKARYCNSQRYSTADYMKIAASSKRVVGIFVPSADARDMHCTGSIIGRNLVLTSRHCLYNDDREEFPTHAKSLRVAFDVDLPEAVRPEPVKVEILTRGRPSLADAPKLDYGLLELKTVPNLSSDHSARASLQRGQICLSTVRLSLDDFVYLVGLGPQGRTPVSDHARVLFPYRPTDQEMAILMYEIREEFGDKNTKLRERFYLSYATADKLSSRRLYVIPGTNGGPSLGVAVNAVPGDSGSPVLARESNRQTEAHFQHAIFRDGQPNRDFMAYLGSWRRHERALPLKPVVEHLNETMPNWMVDYRVCVYGKDDVKTELWSDDENLINECNEICMKGAAL